MSQLIPTEEVIISRIYTIRHQKIMFDFDLAEMYGIETKRLKHAVRRNIERFPEDFMFELTKTENEILRSQFGTSSWGGTRISPIAFTEQGVAMLSSVLNSSTAIQMNIQIIRVFAKMRQFYMDNLNLKLDIEAIKKKVDNHDKNIELVFNYLDELMDKKENEVERTKIGYKN